MPLLLEGVKILDLSWQGPGPFSTMLLSDLGADVIRIEEPAGAGRRASGISLGGSPADRVDAWMVHGRNKRSITINLKSEKGRNIFFALVETADVVVESFRPGVSTRLGVDYERARAVNPRIIYCSISGYGLTGPYRDLAGHDLNYIGVTGALSITGTKDGQLAIPSNLIGDFGGGGMGAVAGILGALYARERLGAGQQVDVSLTDTTFYLMGLEVQLRQQLAQARRPGCDWHNGGLPFYNLYECKDGKHLAIAPLEPWLFAELCRALGREDLIVDQFDEKKHDEMFAFFERTFATRTRDEWIAYLRQFDAAVAPVNTVDEALNDPQLLSREMVVESEHPIIGKVKQVGIPLKFSQTPGAIRGFNPPRGEHTDEILSSLGYPEADIRALRDEGAI